MDIHFLFDVGQVLINWLVSSFSTEERRRDARLLLPQICTDLVTAGVIKQIQDKDATVAGDLFRVSVTFYSILYAYRMYLLNTVNSVKILCAHRITMLSK